MNAFEHYQSLAKDRDLLRLYEELGSNFGGPDDYDPVVALCTNIVGSIPTLPNTSKALTQKLGALTPQDQFSPTQWAVNRGTLFELLRQVELEESERLSSSSRVPRRMEADDRLENYRSKLTVLAGAFSFLTPLHELVSKHHEAALEAADYFDGLDADEAADFEELAGARDRYFLTGSHKDFETYLTAAKVFDDDRVPGNAEYWKLVDELRDQIEVTLMLREVTL